MKSFPYTGSSKIHLIKAVQDCASCIYNDKITNKYIQNTQYCNVNIYDMRNNVILYKLYSRKILEIIWPIRGNIVGLRIFESYLQAKRTSRQY